jgi:hypothetical protein
MYQIEPNIPVPSRAASRPRASKYPLAEMELGDSFQFPAEQLQSVRITCSNWLSRWRPEYGVRVVDQGDGTARLWLVERRKRATRNEEAPTH